MRGKTLLTRVMTAILTVGISMSVNAGLFGLGGMNWKEEVLLHDGSRIVVKRSQSYGGRHEIGQTPPIKEQEITFTVPGSGEHVTWKSEYGEDIGRANFIALALHIRHGIPYIVAEPHLCLAYNKWGRPNPPYVVFKYEGKEWKHIADLRDWSVAVGDAMPAVGESQSPQDGAGGRGEAANDGMMRRAA